MARPGRKSKGERGQIPLRPPQEQLDVYRRLAHDAGYPSTNDYLVAVLAEAHQLPAPAWARPVHVVDQLELPMGA